MNRREALTAGVATAAIMAGPARAAAATGDPAELTIAAAGQAIRHGALSSVALTRACLDHIAAYNKRVNAVITPISAQALAEAAVLDSEAAAGRFRSPLHGVPIALKDNIDTAGTRTTNGSKLFEHHVPATDARVVHLLRQAGAVIVAKANMSEFAIGSATNATSFFGPVRNPWNPDRISGGSSGGSAAAVMTGMALGALGTDSGGSVRIPSAWCGAVGLKPTLGLVPNVGVGPGLPPIDVTGPIARTVEDVALLFGQMTGYDPRDVASVERPKVDYAAGLGRAVSNLRVGVPRRPFFDKLDAPVAAAVDAALMVIDKLTAGLRDVAFAGIDDLNENFIAGDILAFHEPYFPKRSADYQALTRNLLEQLTKGFDDPAAGPASRQIVAQLRAQASLRRRQRTIDAAFDGFDVIVMPTMKTVAPTVTAAVEAEYGPRHTTLASIANTFPFNLLGLPALTVPCGFSGDGLPIGLMIAGPRFSEATLLMLGYAYERATPWRQRRPSLA